MSSPQDYEYDNESYNVKFKGTKEKALEHALDIRKFEIELYWKRATYFWALIAVAFAGFFAVLASDKIVHKEVYVFTIGCIGFVFTWAWFLVNKGSKYWQENWENHVNLLEDSIIGPLYKTTLERAEEGKFYEKYITGPAKLSVSKINQWVSFFTMTIWLFITLTVFDFKLEGYTCILQVLIFDISLLFCILIFKESNSHHSDHKHSMNTRKSIIMKVKGSSKK